MDFGASALAAGLLGVALGLVRVVEFLIKRRNGKNGKNGCGGLTSDQEETLKSIATWATEQRIQAQYTSRDILSMKDETSATNKKIDILVNSQQRLTDRISDFIAAVEKDRSR
jgi:hypothetical protein